VLLYANRRDAHLIAVAEKPRYKVTRLSAIIPNGLTTFDAEERFRAEGPNELPQSQSRNALRIVKEVLREPMLLLLIGACVIYLVLGDTAEALLISVLASASITITVIQELRTERVLAALRDLTAPRALVIRDGKRQRIPGREVVRGDVLVLSEGDRIPADATYISGQNLKVDESLLTGESVPSQKGISEIYGAEKKGRPDVALFSGTLVVAGSGYARVTATASNSEIGKIGKSLSDIKPEAPRLQVQIRNFVRLFAVIGLSLCVVAAIVYGLARGDWLHGALGGLALSMSLLPEEFPVILTVFLAMGAWRISKVRVLTRKASAIETLGSATVLCTDKTGTLTENRMSVAALRTANASWQVTDREGDLPDTIRELLQFSIWASQITPFDPMERALHDLGRENVSDSDTANKRTLLHSYAVSPELPAMSQLWEIQPPEGAGDHSFVIAAKGAPEAIAALCKLGTDERAAMHTAAEEMANLGMRVLGVAKAEARDGNVPETQHGFAFTYLGLVGLRDPLKPSVPSAVRECHSAGIRVVMITGDYPSTARAIARDANIPADEILSGTEIDALDDDALTARAATVTIFARVRPQQKLRIVNALKAGGAVVAMTGDGVNDAPSLKAAHIGIAMGGRGTDVAREASSIVLMDDDFKSIVVTIRLGRRIYDNIRKAMTFVAAIHGPVAGLALLPLLLGLPLVLLPVHIAFLEMIIDPVSSIAFEAEGEEADIMHRPPRDPHGSLISGHFLSQALLQALGALAVVMAVYLFAIYEQRSDAETRSIAFLTLVLANMVLIFVNRAYTSSFIQAFTRPNPTLWWVLVVDCILLALLFLLPPLRALFTFAPLRISDLGVALVALSLLFVSLSFAKGSRTTAKNA
jgi:P-type Ca2+ transporter type 2C